MKNISKQDYKTNYQIKAYQKILNDHKDFLANLKIAAETDLNKLLNDFVKSHLFSFHKLIKHELFLKLYNHIMAKTQFLDDRFNMGTRCWYVLHNKNEIVKCNMCGKTQFKNISVTRNSEIFWCGPVCQSKDPSFKKKLSENILAAKRQFKSKSNYILPTEHEINYHSNEIEYDDGMNARLLDFYNKHKKVFQYWIDKDIELKKYLFEKSYPLDYTELKPETRVKWVLEKMQRIPHCKTCDRQLDFQNVKLSHKWPDFCCMKCKKASMTNANSNWHGHEIYERMLKSEYTYPLFTLEEFLGFDRWNEYMLVKCLKCGNECRLRIDLNFYQRNRKISYFRCPYCFPFLAMRKRSGPEIELQKYVQKLLSDEIIHNGDRTTIYPYELDIHPFGKYSNIAFEYNGVFWHSIDSKQPIEHILNKVKLCESNGIQLLNIWEDDFLNNKEYYFNFINDFIFNRQKLLNELTYNGRKTEISVERMVFNKCILIPGYQLIDETQPEIIQRRRPNSKQIFQCPTAGKLIYRKIN